MAPACAEQRQAVGGRIRNRQAVGFRLADGVLASFATAHRTFESRFNGRCADAIGSAETGVLHGHRRAVQGRQSGKDPSDAQAAVGSGQPSPAPGASRFLRVDPRSLNKPMQRADPVMAGLVDLPGTPGTIEESGCSG